MEGMEEEYKAIPALDVYEATPADEEQVAPLTLQERKEVDKILDERDINKAEKGGNRQPVVLYEEMEEHSEELEARKKIRERRKNETKRRRT